MSRSGCLAYAVLGVVVLATAVAAFLVLSGFFGSERSASSSAPVATAAAESTNLGTAISSTTATTTTTATTPPRALEPGPCVIEVSPAIAVECGFFPVPEDRTDPDSENLRLAVMTIVGSQGAANPDPIVYLDGGPGGPGIQPLDLDAWARLAAATQRDVVLFSQRGTFFSQPNLVCEDTSIFVVELVVDCRRRLASEGRDLGAYTSAVNAEDLAELRLALGYDEWNLLGISYGSRLALTTMRDHPEGIRSVILEGVYPLQVDFYGESAEIDQAVLDRLFRRCAEVPICAEHHPDLEAKLEGIVATLGRKPVVIDLVDRATGEEYPQIVDGTVFLFEVVRLLGDRNAALEVPAIITAAESGDYERLFETASPYLLSDVPIDEEPAEVRFSRGMSLSVQCAEEAPFSAVLIGEGLLERVLAQVALLELELCEIWAVPRADSVENESVRSNIPTLLLSGGLDNVTPLEWALHASITLPNSFQFTFPGDGHGFSVYSPCAVEMITAFLEDPSLEPDPTCIESLPPPVFPES